MADISDLIIHGSMYDEDYVRAVLPHIKLTYFEEESQKVIFEAISEHLNTYNSRPTREAVMIAIKKREDISDDIYQESVHRLDEYEAAKHKTQEREWLLKETEAWCQHRDLVLTIKRSVMIIKGEDKEFSTSSLPQLIQESLAVSFDASIGHDFLDDAECRYDFYHEDLERVPFDIEFLNKITKGGTPNKTLNIIMGGTGGFKSGSMCHFAASNLFAGKNVLYITLELSEERVAERIDANMLDCEIDDLKNLSRDVYINKINAIKEQTAGRLIVKEYPTASAHAGHFRHLLRELRLKKDFCPDVIYIDYLNICASSRCRGGENSYTLVKSIAEELRGLAVEFDVPIWSATQTNRSGYGDTDVGLENTSESFGLPATADFFIAAITSPELDEQGLIMFKQLKNRYGALGGDNEKFVVGINRAKMRLYDAEDGAQDNIMGGSGDISKTQKDVLDEAMAAPQFGASKTNAVDDFKGFDFD